MSNLTARVSQTGDSLVVALPCLRPTYIDAIMRKNCFEELRPLFMRAHAPAKEFTESYAALHHLRKSLTRIPECLVIHVGDGAHCRTGALFAFMSQTDNLCIDPIVNEDVVSEWAREYSVRRLRYARTKIEDYPLEEITEACLVTFVHAHVNTDEVLARIPNWHAAYINPCCHPQQQLSNGVAVDSGNDWAILSPEREYQVILNHQSQGGIIWLTNPPGV